MLTVREAAERISAAYSSVRLWVRSGKFPKAVLQESPAGSYWLIPESDLEGFEKRERGRPPKPAPANGAKPTAAKKSGEMPGPELKAKLRKQPRREK